MGGKPCPSCGTHTGTHWPDCPHGSMPYASRDEAKKANGKVLVAKATLSAIANGDVTGADAKELAAVTLKSL